MKALVKSKKEAGLWMEEIPMPKVGVNDVLIKVKKSAICGTDVHIYQWDAWAAKTIPVPMAVGHEFMGEIVECGRNVKDMKVGQRVSAEGHITCGQCHNCRTGKRHLCPKTVGVGVGRPGSFAEYVCVPQENVVLLPDSIGDEEAAIFDPFGNAVHTALSFNLAGEDVLITGAGPIGLMAAMVARHVGARHVIITDVNDYRLDFARKLGVSAAVNVASESLDDVKQRLSITEGFTVGLEMSGNPRGFATQLQEAQCGAKIALLGILPPDTTIDWDLVIFKGLFLKGIYGREIFDTWYKMIHLIESGLKISSIITHRYAIDEYEKGFKAMISGNSGKVILNWE